jgi:hypothetical protein
MKSKTKNNLLTKIVKEQCLRGRFVKTVELTAEKVVKVEFAESFDDYRKNIVKKKDLAFDGIDKEQFDNHITLNYLKKAFWHIVQNAQKGLDTKGLTFDLKATIPSTGEKFQLNGSFIYCQTWLYNSVA